MIARLRLQIVEKAVWESKYCSLYAELCHRFALQADIDAGDAQQPQSQQPRAADDADENARPENAARNTYLAVLSVCAFLSYPSSILYIHRALASEQHRSDQRSRLTHNLIFDTLLMLVYSINVLF